MDRNSCWLSIVVCGLTMAGLLCGQEQPAPAGNNEVINMLRANVPESVIVSQIEILAGRGANYDISPSAIIALQSAGASERVLNTMMWVQMTIVPSITVPVPSGVFYRSGGNAVKLNSFLLSAEFIPRWSAWPFYAMGAKTVAMNASASMVQVSEAVPTLFVQGLGSDAGWQLVKMNRGMDYRELRLKRKGAFSSDFFSDSVFDRAELRPLTFAPEGERTFTVRPAVPLEPGAYALCGQVNGSFLRACYEFQVSGT